MKKKKVGKKWEGGGEKKRNNSAAEENERMEKASTGWRKGVRKEVGLGWGGSLSTEKPEVHLRLPIYVDEWYSGFSVVMSSARDICMAPTKILSKVFYDAAKV